jgi:hypothetical protein
MTSFDLKILLSIRTWLSDGVSWCRVVIQESVVRWRRWYRWCIMVEACQMVVRWLSDGV